MTMEIVPFFQMKIYFLPLFHREGWLTEREN
jgi:hypothetical protein